jgi:hypothetical protein
MAASSPIAVRTMTSGRISLDANLHLSIQLTGVLALLGEELVDLVANLTLGELDIILGGAVLRHEGEETVVSNVKL